MKTLPVETENSQGSDAARIIARLGADKTTRAQRRRIHAGFRKSRARAVAEKLVAPRANFHFLQPISLRFTMALSNLSIRANNFHGNGPPYTAHREPASALLESITDFMVN